MINLNKVSYITLYTGGNGSAHCTCNCPCCSQKNKNNRYQGTKEHVEELLDKVPNLQQLYVLGNPDPSVDPDFCHEVICMAVERGIKVATSTSGVGGAKILKKIFAGIPSQMVDYISFSIDSVRTKDMSLLKGINYPFEEAIKGIKWAIDMGYTVKIQPTLWACNYDQIAEIIEYFCDIGIKWFSCHIGSLEAGVNLSSHSHLTKEEIMEVHALIDNVVKKHTEIKVKFPCIFEGVWTNEKAQKYYCSRPDQCRELLVYFEKNGIFCTHTPLASSLKDEFTFEINDAEYKMQELQVEKGVCPFSKELCGDETICRYICRLWNY